MVLGGSYDDRSNNDVMVGKFGWSSDGSTIIMTKGNFRRSF